MASVRNEALFRFDPARRAFVVKGREVRLPRNRAARIATGGLLVGGGLLGFLPVLGFWMVPVGLIVLSQDFATVRRWRRNAEIRYGRWRRRRSGSGSDPGPGSA